MAFLLAFVIFSMLGLSAGKCSLSPLKQTITCRNSSKTDILEDFLRTPPPQRIEQFYVYDSNLVEIEALVPILRFRTQLKTLILENCQLETMENFQYWPNIVLSLAKNKLKTMSFLLQVRWIQELYLNGNLFEHIENVFLHLTALKILDLRENHIKYFDNSVFENLPLLYLKLDRNYIVSQKFSFSPQNPPRGFVFSLSRNSLKRVQAASFENGYFGTLNLSNCMIETIDTGAWSKVPYIGNLDLSHNSLTYLTEQLPSFISGLDLSFNSIKRLDNAVFISMTSLNFLNLSHNSLTDIPQEILHLKPVERLDFSFNALTTLDNVDFSTLPYLKSVDFSWNFLANFPNSTRVNLTGNSFKTLRNQTNLYKIRELDLSNASISTIETGAFRGFPLLEILLLRMNKIREIRAGTFASLGQLQRLDLTDNGLKMVHNDAFPTGNLLRVLGVSFSGNLENSFRRLNMLQTLTISNCDVNLTKAAFQGLYQLSQLSLENVRIGRVEPGVFHPLFNLDTFNPRALFQKARHLPGLLSGLERIQALDLSNLPALALENGSFLGLPHVKSLNLSGNSLTSLPPGTFQGLENLESLHLAQNNFTTIPLGAFQNMESLGRLNLSHNQISTLLNGVFTHLTSLTVLDLSNNLIVKFKIENFFPLGNIQSLDLTGNLLIEFPAKEFVASFRSIRAVALNNNRWKCRDLARILELFRIADIEWVFEKGQVLDKENIDGVKCIDICNYFYCPEDYPNVRIMK